ncbi:MAG: ATP-dependent DNA helicase RecG [Acidimicrobiia bacterium]|nr:ATP-dependent DNA helicase RecG [Acidimicrobiia bacterium]
MDVERLKGVGEKKAEALRTVGIDNVLDLLTHYPRRWIDRTNEARIRDLLPGEQALVLVTVQAISGRRTRGRPPKSLVTADVTDGSGHLRVTFFNQAWRERQLSPGTQAALFGKLELFNGRKQMTSPIVDLIGDKTGKVVPIYPQSEKAGLTTSDIGTFVAEVLRRSTVRGILDPVPADVLARFDLVGREAAIRGIHGPDGMDEQDRARERLVFDELLGIQLALVLRKQALEQTARGIRHDVSGELVDRFLGRLPFDLTAGQRDAIAALSADLAGPHPMHRLLQGDVGAGKTVVAVTALLAAVEGGHQGALMAPTEVLAEQHALGVRPLLAGLTVGAGEGAGQLFDQRELAVGLLTNRTTAKERERLLVGLAEGTVDVVIGTHALIEEGIAFRSLGVVVVDEQHRFGVEQRAALRDKGAGGVVPDVLVMTATPIPRTAAMTVYGDLDVTEIKTAPEGRKPITTVWERTRPHADGQLSLAELAVWDHVKREVEAGHQAFVVCPLIEESEKLEVRSAQATFDELDAGPLAGLRLGLLHGRLRPTAKEATMEQFRAARLDVLVATSVIEVGVDVPNATVMVILDADRFGIAQLHQLRGRVGRAQLPSWCYLVAAGQSPDAERRLEALCDPKSGQDGFVLAEVDLEVRGEGTVFATRQKGRNDLKLASLLRDRGVVARAREVAFELVGADPGLARHAELLDEVTLFLDEDEREFLAKS